MGYKIEFREKARAGIIDGYRWYESKQAGLGARFVSEVENAVYRVSQYPLHFQKRYKNYREICLDSFPFVVVYELKLELIIFSAVFPTKSDPSKKY
ncbi:type II toxin-antitoxin system RelE/ParE family toxin [Phaeocystidibacter luteus]|uniref:Type II toxin-antitoxin system RelE/ParE family toxin n=1 Tax=Phaeocystidibacter luteus TaxID=911197 RepID=A0A6N6RIR5_9FLAO|nr:type II toxin-antitoxin system RelE/ParE family toxin [Phaeocystidibacter luteus]